MTDLTAFRRAGDGSDDAPAINRFLAGGGGELTGGPYRLLGPLIYPSGVRFDCRAKLVYLRGWPSAHAMTSTATRGMEKITRDVVIDFRQGGEIIIPGAQDKGAPRKGIAIRKTDGFHVYGARVTGDGGLFALEVIDSRRGVVQGGLLSVLPADIDQQGADGSHNSGWVEDVQYIGIETFSGDDASSLCIEDALRAGAVQRRISYRDCILHARGHSAIKMLLLPAAGAAVVEDVLFSNCTHIIQAYDRSGAPFSLRNRAEVQGGRIRNVLIQGGTLEVRRPASIPSSAAMEPVIQAENIENLRFRNFTVKSHFSPQLIVATACTGTEPIWDSSCSAAPNPEVQSVFRRLPWIVGN